MSTTIILTAGPENSFSRSKLQSISAYQRQSINNLLDKIETIYKRLLPGKSKLIWIIYFLVLSLFLLSGVVKNLSHRPENYSARVQKSHNNGEGRRNRLLQQPAPTPAHPGVNPVPPSLPNSAPGSTPMAASDMNMRIEEEPASDYNNYNLTKYQLSLLYHMRRGIYFILEVFFILFPFYFCWSRYHKRAFVLSLVKDLIEIENRQFITNYQFKVEISDLSVITIVQFDSEGYHNEFDRSTTKLVLDKKLPSKRASLHFSTPIVSI